jgi:hypothetical protein
MSGVGDLNTRVRRPSAAGSNTQILFNFGGVEGATANLTFNVSSNTLNSFFMNAAANLVAGNISTPQNTSTGNLTITTLANTVTLNVSQNAAVGNISAANINVSATINTAANLVAGNISTPQNTSTGNLSVTQNTTTGNIVISTLANTVTLNVSQNIFAPNCPMSNTITGVETGIGSVMTGNSTRTSTTALTAENNLSCTLGNTGVYALECLINYSGSNGASGLNGFKLSWGGSCTVNTLSYSVVGTNNSVANISTRQLGFTNAVTTQYTTIGVSDWVLIKGVLTINATGTFFPMYAQVVSNGNSVNIQSNSYIVLTRIK